jgi:hypothetical protein
MLHALFISPSFSSSLSLYLVKSTSYGIPHYALKSNTPMKFQEWKLKKHPEEYDRFKSQRTLDFLYIYFHFHDSKSERKTVKMAEIVT